MFLSVIIAYLKEEDFAAADRASKDFLSVQGFAMSDCGRAAFDALDAYDKCDQSALDAVTKRQVFSFLDNEVRININNKKKILLNIILLKLKLKYNIYKKKKLICIF